jgi:hypothetical protein
VNLEKIIIQRLNIIADKKNSTMFGHRRADVSCLPRTSIRDACPDEGGYFLAQSLENGLRVVRGSIIHHHELEFDAAAVPGTGAQTVCQQFGAIAGGYNDRNRRVDRIGKKIAVHAFLLDRPETKHLLRLVLAAPIACSSSTGL